MREINMLSLMHEEHTFASQARHCICQDQCSGHPNVLHNYFSARGPISLRILAAQRRGGRVKEGAISGAKYPFHGRSNTALCIWLNVIWWILLLTWCFGRWISTSTGSCCWRQFPTPFRFNLHTSPSLSKHKTLYLNQYESTMNWQHCIEQTDRS